MEMLTITGKQNIKEIFAHSLSQLDAVVTSQAPLRHLASVTHSVLQNIPTETCGWYQALHPCFSMDQF